MQRAGERACYDYGWLQTCHSFCFADYYDPGNVNWGALRVFNDDVVAPGEGFPEHAHRDMEIVTYVLEGLLEHTDSRANHGIVGPGGAQYMSAGTGIRHSEFNHSKTERLHVLQMWILPGKRGTEPSYGQVEFAEPDRLNTWLPVASGHPEVSAPVRLTQDAVFYVTRLEADRRLRHTFEPGRFGFLFAADGMFTAEGFTANEFLVGREDISPGDAVRAANLERLALIGTGVAVLWDVPQIPIPTDVPP
jgi:redox-sensitive bicupin YhaK (pirin superfamily)